MASMTPDLSPRSAPALASLAAVDAPATRLAGAPFTLPLLFILFWSSGYPMGKLGLLHAGPLSLLSLRFGLAAGLLLLLCLCSGAPWPRRWRDWGHLAVAGLLIQVLHFFGVYQAMHLGLPSGVAALLCGLMPLLTALLGRVWLAERLGPRQGRALALGLAGVGLVVLAKPLQAAAGESGALALQAYGAGLLGLLGLVLGTLYQKRFCAGMDLRSGSFVQMAVAALLMTGLAWRIEGGAGAGVLQVDWHSAELGWVLLWLAAVNSIGAFSLMFVMVRRGTAARVATLFFLIPGVSTLLGFVLLDERLPALALAGIGLSALALWWGRAQAGAAAAEPSSEAAGLSRSRST